MATRPLNVNESQRSMMAVIKPSLGLALSLTFF